MWEGAETLFYNAIIVLADFMINNIFFMQKTPQNRVSWGVKGQGGVVSHAVSVV